MPSSPAPGIQGQSQLLPNGGALAKANLKLIFFTCGSGEVGSYGCNNADTVRGYAESNDLGSIIEEFIVQGGAHNAATWRPSFWNFAQLAHEAGFTTVGSACGGGGGGMGGMAGASGAAGSGMTSGAGGMGVGGMTSGAGGMDVGGMTSSAGAGGTNGGSGVTGGSAGDAGAPGGAGNGAGGVTGGTSGSSAEGGSAGMSGAGMTGAAATGGATPATGGMGNTSSTTGGAPATGGGPGTGGALATGGAANEGGAELPPVEDGGCACSLRGAQSKTSPFALLAAAGAIVLFTARARRRRDRRS